MARLTRRVVLMGLAVAGIAIMGLLAFQRQLIYFPGGAVPDVEQVLPGAEDVVLQTEDGLELSAWYLEAGPTAALVLPGNAGNRAARAPLARALAEAGMSVLLVDYRGYGGNPGSPSEDGLLHDARAAHDWLRNRAAVERVVYLGESLGTGVAAALATEAPPAAMVLRSPFPSLLAVARRHYGPVPGWLLLDQYPAAEHLADVEVPVLVVIGDADRIIPPDLSRQAAEAAAGPAEVVTIEHAGHNDPALLAGERFVAAVEGFLRRHGVLQ